MKQSLTNLKDLILENRVILFLGQDYLRYLNKSLDSLIPHLLQSLKKDLKKDEILKGFYDVCRLLLAQNVTPEHLSDTLQRITSSIPLNDDVRLIAKTPWRAIYTTAIDDILTRSVEETQTRLVRNVYEKGYKLVNPRDPSNMYLFRLMGSVDQIAPARMPSYSSLKDRRGSIRGLLDHIEEIAGIGDAVFLIAGVDQKKEDPWIYKQLSERIEDLDQNLASYWFGPSPNLSAGFGTEELIDDERLVIESEVDFLEFLKQFEKEISEKISHSEDRSVRTKSGTVTFTESQWRSYAQHMVVLNGTALQPPELKFNDAKQKYERFREFLRGEHHPDWSAHAAGFVFFRPVMGSVEKIADKMLQHGRSKDNSVITVSGPSGCGKTILLEHIAWRLAKDHPVIFLPKRIHNPDFKVIDAFCQAVQPEGELEKGASAANRVVIVWDSLEAAPTRYNALATYLASQGRPALVLGSTFAPPRRGGFRLDGDELEVGGEMSRLINRQVPTHLTKEAAGDFVTYLRKIDPDLLDFMNETKFTETLTEDFLVAMYDHIPELREQLSTGARVQYRTYEELLRPRVEKLFDTYKKEWKNLLPLVFVPSQFNCFPNLELVLDAMGRGYRQLWLEEDKSMILMEGLLFQDWTSGIHRLRARNSRVARISLSGLSTLDQIKYIEKLADAVKPQYMTELQFLYDLFDGIKNTMSKSDNEAERFGLYAHYQDKLADILGRFRERFEYPPLMHIEANFIRRSISRFGQPEEIDYETATKKFNQAIEILKRALDLVDKESNSNRVMAEKQNIANSLGATFRDLINVQLSFIEDNKDLSHEQINEVRKQIEEEFSLLLMFCDKAEIGAYHNIYPVDVRVTSLLGRYKNDTGATEEQKREWAVWMIEELDRATYDFGENDLTTLLNTRVEVEGVLQQFQDQRVTIEELRRRGSLSGFYLKARMEAYYFKRKTGKFTPRSREGLETGFAVLKELPREALFNDVSCLSLHNRIWWDLNTGNCAVGEKRDVTVSLTQEQWHEYFEMIKQQSELGNDVGHRSLFLKFMLAWAAMQVGESSYANRIFRQLARVGSRFRTASLVRLSNEDGTPRKFTGEVIDFLAESTGLVYVPTLRVEIPFKVYQFGESIRKGDPLGFEIMLNFRGPLAVPDKGKIGVQSK